VESIATTARQAEGQQGLSFEVEILLSDTGGVAIRPGMSCRAEIFTARKENTLAVPVAAVRYSEDDSKAASEDATGKPGKGDAYVFLDHQGVAVKTSVDTGVSNDSLQEITSGLKQGDPVIIGPYRTVRQLHDGDAVHPEKPGRSTQAT
jgi:HlyD family secretion protein